MAALPNSLTAFTENELLTSARMNVLSAFINALAGREGVVELENSLEAAIVLPVDTGPTAAANNGQMRWQGNDAQIADGAEWITPLTSREVNYENLSANSGVGSAAAQVAQGNHRHPIALSQQAAAQFDGQLSRWGTGVINGAGTLDLPPGIGYLDLLVLTGGHRSATLAGRLWHINPPARTGWTLHNPGAIAYDTPIAIRWSYYLWA